MIMIYFKKSLISNAHNQNHKKEEYKKLLLILIKIYYMNSLFAGCSSLKYLSNISKWNIKNSKDINLILVGWASLIDLHDILKWNA